METERQTREKQEVIVAGILDELSEVSFSKACTFINLDRFNWRNEIAAAHPLFLFVESAWRGKENSWYQEISSVHKELRSLVAWCKDNKIPTVFWNKEDPLYFEQFFSAAALFDWVFTTELDCVPAYRQLLRHSQVGFLPFAAEVGQYNPLTTGKRKHAACFAGSYYAKQKERCKDFEKMYGICKEHMEVDIYARMPNKANPQCTYPKQYAKDVKGTVSPDKVSEIYKSYEYAVTINTVKEGTTMFARRAVEIGACNTLLFSNWCKGLHTLFGELIVYMREPEAFKQIMMSLKEKETYYRKLRLALYRKVMLEHTYEHRIRELCKRVLGKEIRQEQKTVLIFSIISSKEEEQYIRKLFAKQTYQKKRLLLLGKESMIHHVITDYETAEYYSYFSPENYYGCNYIMDLMIALRYAGANIIGKGKYISYQEGIYIENSCEEYQYQKGILYDRCIMSYQVAKEKTKKFLEEGFAIDCFNFCEGYHGCSCEYVEDLKLDIGMGMEQLYTMAETKEALRSSQYQYWISAKELKDSFRKQSQSIEISECLDNGICVASGIRKINDLYLDSDLIFSVQEYGKEGVVSIFLSGEKKGNAAAVLKVWDEENRLMKINPLGFNAFTRVEMPIDATHFSFSLRMESYSKLYIEEIIINLNIR